ncbi:MAG: type II toxin-antitoxin system VapC family toxin [Myxococcota bacterium]
MRLAIDTNRYRDLCDAVPEVVDTVARAREVFVPLFVLAELRAGFALGRRGRENERTLTRFLDKPGVELLVPGESTTRAYAELYRQLRSQGTPIPTNDLWIAALVVEHGLSLLTRDPHFRHLPQLELV